MTNISTFINNVTVRGIPRAPESHSQYGRVDPGRRRGTTH